METTLSTSVSSLSLTARGMPGESVVSKAESELHKCVYCIQIDINMEPFIWAELADTHLAYGAAHGNGRKAQRIYHEIFLNRIQIIVRCLLSTVA
jgi:hypothetical protein